MHYLVTGGTGFLGRAIVEKLLADDHQVRVLDNNYRGDPSMLPTCAALEVVNGDIRDSEFVKQAGKDVDSIIHLAFINGTRHFYEQPGLVVDVGIKGMINVAESAEKNQIKEIILISTSETYQSPSVIPTPENVPLIVPDILNPRYSYGGAKIASELILVNYCATFLKNWRIIRPHNIYGPNMGNDHVIPALINKAFEASGSIQIQGDGQQRRSFCHIDDFANAFQAILRDSDSNQIYHVGTQDEITIQKLTELILKMFGKDIRIQTSPANPGETYRRCPDITKISNLGFKPQIALQDGVKKMVDYYIEASKR